MSFERPNLPTIIQEIEEVGKAQSAGSV